MRHITKYFENAITWWMFTINVILYSIGFFIYEKCINVIQTTDINTDNVVKIMFNHPGESVGLFLGGLFLNIFSFWLIVVAIFSIVYLVSNNFDKSDLIMAILNCVLAISAIVLNILFVKIYWEILIVLIVIGGIIYLIGSSN